MAVQPLDQTKQEALEVRGEVHNTLRSHEQPVTIPQIKVATSADEAAITHLITLAFSADPVVRWAQPDPQQYLTYMPQIVKAFAGKAFAHGSAYYVDGYAGAALWLPPMVEPDEDELLPLLQSTILEQQQADFFAIFEQMGNYHPHEPHWYLPLIGVDPISQSQGYGSALMRHALLACDRDRTLAYLESSNPRNIPLYERHGFERLGTIQVGTAPPVVPMLREPQ